MLYQVRWKEIVQMEADVEAASKDEAIANRGDGEEVMREEVADTLDVDEIN